jgi:plastocyanin
MRLRALVLPWLALGLTGCAAGTAVFQGRVPAAAAPETVVWVEGVPSRAQTASPEVVRVRQDDGGFRPHVVMVPVGSTVEFVNAGQMWHNAFSVSPARKFDLGKYAPGQRRRVTFPNPGVVRLFCDLHPGAEAWVVVTPKRALTARPDATGTVRLPPLPPGTYVVRAWDPERGERKHTVKVDARKPAGESWF